MNCMFNMGVRAYIYIYIYITDDQLELTYSSYVKTQDVTLNVTL